MEISNRDLDKTFTKLEVAETDCNHHRRGFVCDANGAPLLPVYYSRGPKGLKGKSAYLFIKSLYLSEPEFRKMVKCHIDRPEYLAMVLTRI